MIIRLTKQDLQRVEALQDLAERSSTIRMRPSAPEIVRKAIEEMAKKYNVARG